MCVSIHWVYWKGKAVKTRGNSFEFSSFISDDDSWEQKKMRLAEKRSKRGIPPVSPNACIKDAVASEVFDRIWSNVIGILEELIKKNWETTITGIWYFYIWYISNLTQESDFFFFFSLKLGKSGCCKIAMW